MNFIIYFNDLYIMNWDFLNILGLWLYYWNRLNMPTFIEQMTTENQTEISNLSLFIMKSFEIRFFYIFWLSMHLALSFLYVFDLMICNCIYIECIYVYVLPVYSEAFLPIVFWNKLLNCWYTICDLVIYYLWGCSTGQHNMLL